MMKVVIADMFKSKAHTLVNTVNCVGVVGKGIALEFKKRFPEMHEDYERLGPMFVVKPGPTFDDAGRAYKRDLADWNDTIDALADLFVRMHSQQAELAATVHFTAKDVASKKMEQPSERDVLAEVMRWKQRRRPALQEAEVAATIRALGMLGWLKVKPSSDIPVSEDAVLNV